ncbi:MAG: CPBP family intramembrane metalloprotease [Propionibacteriaceae bacterium]|nr:CPBP family intramembrane metalloprotease [Propionibacteriaceae bacterium]
MTETDYARFYRTPAWRGWKPVVLVIAAFAAMQILGSVILGIAMGIMFVASPEDVEALFGATDSLEEFDVQAFLAQLMASKEIFIANFISLGALLPVCFLLSFLIMRQRPGYLSSVTGRFRWAWFGPVVGVIGVICIAIVGFLVWSPVIAGEQTVGLIPDTWLLLITVIVIVPFQSAAEEYLCRGLVFRGVTSFFGAKPSTGLIIGAVASTLIFMGLHLSTDVGQNVFYAFFGLTACWLTWRTGGLEAAIALHLANNMVGMSSLPFTGLTSEMFDRSAGATSWQGVLLQIVQLVLAIAAVELLVRWRRPVRTSAPGLATGSQIATMPWMTTRPGMTATPASPALQPPQLLAAVPAAHPAQSTWPPGSPPQ